MPRQRDMKRIRRAEEQMKPDEITVPVPNQIAEREHPDDQRDINGKKYGASAMTKFVLETTTWPPFGSDLHPFDLAAEQPCPQRVRQFVAEHVNPHRLGQQQENDDPACRPGEERNPVVSAPPHARSTRHNASAAPAQTGSSKTAMMNLIHFGTRGRFCHRGTESTGERISAL